MRNSKNLARSILLLTLAGAVAALLIAGCVSPTAEPLDVLFSATPSLTPSATIQWFPATVTPEQKQQQPTATPNSAATPDYGSLLFSDTFSGPGDWLNSQSVNGYVIVKDNLLTLAIKPSKGTLTALRQKTSLDNFYLEVTLNPMQYCSPDDQVGVLFRTQSELSYYRLLINCQGMVSLQVVVGGTPGTLVNWTPSGQVPSGLWKAVRIGVWTSGNSMRIYMNGQLLFETTRETFSYGGIGFYARASGDNPLTVNFSDLKVYKVNKVLATESTLTPVP